MSTIYQSQAMNAAEATRVYSSPGKGLKITTIVIGVIGLIVWGTSVGIMLGWESSGLCLYSGGMARITYGWFISVPANVGMIYVTARIIFLITSHNFPSPALHVDLRECVARMVGLTVVLLSMWAASLSWLVKDDCEHNVVYHVCNYGFIDSALVAGFAGGLYRVTSKAVMHQENTPAGASKFAAPQPPQTHYNQAYVHHQGHYR